MNKLKVIIRKDVTDYHELQHRDIQCKNVSCLGCPANKDAGCVAAEASYPKLSEKERALFVLKLCEEAEWVMEGEE